MYEARPYCTHKILKLLYNCLIYSYLNYCNSVWGYCTKYALQLLNVVQKKILRAMTRLRFNTHTRDNFNSYSLLTMENIKVYMVGCINKAEFGAGFMQRFSVHLTRLDESMSLCVPRVTNKHSKQFISYWGAVVWNNIHLDTCNQTYNCFKIRFKRTLLFRKGRTIFYTYDSVSMFVKWTLICFLLFFFTFTFNLFVI